ncbi:MAG: exodeoxyribonuclease VII large subunit, partial [Treponema sp.]|nr:exodeoxyribonuclease VII large subunit [Treponema sp.]
MSQLFPKDTVFTVTNLTSLIRDLLEGTFSNITLEGEISNYRPNASGHLYFTLKDEG